MSGLLPSLLTFFLAVCHGLLFLVAPMTMVYHGVSWQMIASLVAAAVFFALPFQAFQTGKFNPPLTLLGFICLGFALQGWAFVAAGAK